MPNLKELTNYLDGLLELERYPLDPSNNGLQFQAGTNDVRKAAFAVDACEATISAAADLDADFLFVHHGLSWGPGVKRFTGVLGRRLTALAANGVSLYAAHLPLDAHAMLGHNALLAEMIGLENPEPFGSYHNYRIGVQGILPKPMTLKQIAKKFNETLPSEGEFGGIGDFDRKLRHLAVISGGGAWGELFDEIAETEVEALVTGEISHQIWHSAMETGTSILTLGHYRSETPGVIAVMNAVREQFSLEVEFIDIPTYL